MIKAAAAKVIGHSHVSLGVRCQDAVKTRNLRNRACIALADGAGSKRHSMTGANTLVKMATQEILDKFDLYYQEITDSKSDLADAIVEKFNLVLERKACRRHGKVSDYASTLLFFACDKNRYIAGHIGDGVIFARFGVNLVTLSVPQNGEYANITYFITDADASKRLRLYAGEYIDELDVLLMSDGTAESLYNKATGNAAPGVSRLLDILRDISAKEMKRVLLSNLDKVFSQKTTDDCSIAALVVLP